MTAAEKNRTVLARLHARGLTRATLEHAAKLRRAEATLHRWAEGECGDSNDYASTVIERDGDDATDKPYRVVRPHKGGAHRYTIPDRERGALATVAKVCAEIGAHYYHQTDPRGCALYVAAEPLTASNYTNGAACGA